MKRPICEFVENYAKKNPVRFHMPGHKGSDDVKCAKFDITEIDGADVLYNEEGIIEDSQKITSDIFGSAKTLFSCEGSSLSIRAMVYMTKLYALKHNKNTKILSFRNAHKTFISACAILNVDIKWLYFKTNNLLSNDFDIDDLEKIIDKEKPVALYVTSPDYLGNISDIRKMSEICKAKGILLLVDNAHGSYLKFLENSIHPIDLGADLSCDSAHKTLGCLTGGAYLHISKNAPKEFLDISKRAMMTFASTSPSYLILQSLDNLNVSLKTDFKTKLNETKKIVDTLKSDLLAYGFTLIGDEPLKLTISTKPFGYEACKVNEYLNNKNIYAEFYDKDYIVFMFSIHNTKEEIDKLKDALLSLPKKERICEKPPKLLKAKKVLSPFDAYTSFSKTVDVNDSFGCVLSQSVVSCPPAVSIGVCGEEIDENMIELFNYYEIKYVDVIE